MKDNKVFKTAIRPILLMIVGLVHFTQNLLLSIVLGICIYFLVNFIDRDFKKRR